LFWFYICTILSLVVALVEISLWKNDAIWQKETINGKEEKVVTQPAPVVLLWTNRLLQSGYLIC